jgi:hypothetical protein
MKITGSKINMLHDHSPEYQKEGYISIRGKVVISVKQYPYALTDEVLNALRVNHLLNLRTSLQDRFYWLHLKIHLR